MSLVDRVPHMRDPQKGGHLMHCQCIAMTVFEGNLLSMTVHGLPRSGVKGELLEELELAAMESAMGVRT